MSTNLDEITKILSTPLALRTKEMIKVLMELTRPIAFFGHLIKELGYKMHYRICEFLGTEVHPEEHILFKEGDPGEKFYIIIKGKVKLLASQKIFKEGELVEIAQLSEGKSFGELSLIKNQPRTATVVCIENCRFMTLSKDHYNRLLGKSFAKKLEERIDFLHGLAVFKSWAKKSLEKLSYFFTKQEYKQNDVIYHENDLTDRVYAIMNGEIELTCKSLRMSCSSFPKVLKVAIIGRNDFFGDDEILLNVPRKYTATVLSKKAEVFSISSEDFISKIDKDSLKTLARTNHERNKIRQGRLKTIEKMDTSQTQESSTSPVPKEIYQSYSFVSYSSRRPITRSKNPVRSLGVSAKVIDNIIKRSKLDQASPTISIISNCTIIAKPKSSNIFFNSRGFQPSTRIKCGSFKKLTERLRYFDI